MTITLSVLWKTREGEAALPTIETRKDPILWGIWVMKTDWKYAVTTQRGIGMIFETVQFVGEKEAVAEYKRRVKDFPRSKEVHYSFPVDASIP